jgi:predicted PurR-regulated permease PerM
MHVFFKEARIVKIKSGVTYADRTFGKYLIGVLIDALAVGSITAVGMLIFNMPYIPLVSVIIACTNIIPVFGPFIGGIPSFIIIFIADPFKALLFILMIFLIQQIDGNFIAPRIYGSTTGLPALYVIIAITVMGGLFGIIGMIIGVPVFAIIGGMIAHKTNQRIRMKKAEIDEGAKLTQDGYTEKDYEGFDEFEDDYSGRPEITEYAEIALNERISPSISANEEEITDSEVENK